MEKSVESRPPLKLQNNRGENTFWNCHIIWSSKIYITPLSYLFFRKPFRAIVSILGGVNDFVVPFWVKQLHNYISKYRFLVLNRLVRYCINSNSIRYKAISHHTIWPNLSNGDQKLLNRNARHKKQCFYIPLSLNWTSSGAVCQFNGKKYARDIMA